MVQQYKKKKRNRINLTLVFAIGFTISCSGFKYQRNEEHKIVSLFPESNIEIERKLNKQLKKNATYYKQFSNHIIGLEILCDTIDGSIIEITDSSHDSIDSQLITLHEIVITYMSKFSKVNIQSGALKGQKWRKQEKYLVLFWLEDRNKLKMSVAILWSSR